jgi:hypothetical protein
VAGIEAAIGETLWGVLYELTLEDRKKLDKNEGYVEQRDSACNSYNPISVTVFDVEETSIGISVFTYSAVPQRDFNGKPSRDYLCTILAGAREHDLPVDYIAILERIQTS